jgi:hypothetical protein
MICPTCHSKYGGWWVDRAGKRIAQPADESGDHSAIWHSCPDCIGGIASCCDAAGSQQPEPEPEKKG